MQLSVGETRNALVEGNQKVFVSYHGGYCHGCYCRLGLDPFTDSHQVFPWLCSLFGCPVFPYVSTWLENICDSDLVTVNIFVAWLELRHKQDQMLKLFNKLKCLFLERLKQGEVRGKRSEELQAQSPPVDPAMSRWPFSCRLLPVVGAQTLP